MAGTIYFETEAEAGAVVSFDDASSRPLKSLVVDIAPVQSGSGDPSPDNVRPITGWTGAKVYTAGENLLNIPASVTKSNIIFTRDSEGYVTASPNNSDPRTWEKASAQYSIYLKAGSYKLLSFVKTPTSLASSDMYIFASNGTRIWRSELSGGSIFAYDRSFSINIPSDGTYYIQIKQYGAVVRFMIIDGSSESTVYEPFYGRTATVSWQSEAGTVYGGTVDLTTGKLTVTDAEIASYNGETLPSTWISDRDVYAVGITPTIGAQVVYKLADPVEYDLTPTEISALAGITNNVWADIGNILQLIYYRGIPYMVEQRIKANVGVYSVPAIVHAVQEDTARLFIFELEDYQIDGTETASLMCVRPDGSAFSYAGVVDSDTNTVAVPLYQEGGALSQVGNVAAQLVLAFDGAVLCSFKMGVIVEEKIGGEATQDDITFLAGLQAQLDQAIGQFVESTRTINGVQLNSNIVLKSAQFSNAITGEYMLANLTYTQVSSW